MAQRGINLTVLTATLLAMLFTFFMKDNGKALQGTTTQDNIHLFLCVCIPILFLYGVLLQLTVATWIYQLGMILRIARYWNWIVTEKIDHIIGRTRQTFLWDLIKDPPWERCVEKRLVRYFQPAFLYALCLFAFLGFPVALFWKAPNDIYKIVKGFGVIGFPVLAATLLILIIIHFVIIWNTEGSQVSLLTESEGSENLGPPGNS